MAGDASKQGRSYLHWRPRTATSSAGGTARPQRERSPPTERLLDFADAAGGGGSAPEAAGGLGGSMPIASASAGAPRSPRSIVVLSASNSTKATAELPPPPPLTARATAAGRGSIAQGMRSRALVEAVGRSTSTSAGFVRQHR